MARRATKKVVSRLKREPRYGVTFIKAWRKYRNLTQVQLAERLDVSHPTIGRVEKGETPYDQPMLEALAEALETDVASLLIRDPNSPDAIWSIWERAKPAQRVQIIEVAKTLLRTGT